MCFTLQKRWSPWKTHPMPCGTDYTRKENPGEVEEDFWEEETQIVTNTDRQKEITGKYEEKGKRWANGNHMGKGRRNR